MTVIYSSKFTISCRANLISILRLLPHKSALRSYVSLIIPLNDYITYSGKRIDKSGIQPDIEIESDQAAAYVLKQLKGHTED